MVFLIRFSYVALLLIFTQLLIPAFRPGGRYLILVAAVAITYFSQIVRKVCAGKMLKHYQAILSGSGIVILPFIFKLFFNEVKPAFFGILVAYLGLILLEMLLPNEWYELMFQRQR